MSKPSDQQAEEKPRDAAYWADPVSRLTVSNAPAEAVNLNVEGRKLVGPLQGFGKMWQKTFTVRLSGSSVTPQDLIETWKQNFSDFWPKTGRFYGPLTGIAPGEVAVINIDTPGGMPLSTGVMVIYADDESFTFMTPEGHMFASWITFSAQDSDGVTTAQVQELIRTNDPLYEVAMRLFGFKKQEQFWQLTLESLASHFGVAGQVNTAITCVDPRLQWSQAGNVWHNAGIRTAIYTMAAPARWVTRLGRSSK